MAKSPPKPRFKSDIRIKPDTPRRPVAEKIARPCARKGCGGEGAFNVPKSRDDLDDRLWLCLEHAREHNESWDYFRGMDDKDIERFQVEAMFGHRPTWPLGKRAAKMRNGETSERFRDVHSVFGEDGDGPAPRKPERQLTRLQVMAFETLHLEQSATLNEIKARYKELVKRFHPDTNGGSRAAEERLKQVIKAYGILRASGLA